MSFFPRRRTNQSLAQSDLKIRFSRCLECGKTISRAEVLLATKVACNINLQILSALLKVQIFMCVKCNSHSCHQKKSLCMNLCEEGRRFVTDEFYDFLFERSA